jgi:uncharacterized protein DUF6510
MVTTTAVTLGSSSATRGTEELSTPMLALDGNAIGGDLLQVFGADLTGARCVCAACFAEAAVYIHGPGRVARCRACGEPLIVLVTVRDITCVDISGIAELHITAVTTGLAAPAAAARSR